MSLAEIFCREGGTPQAAESIRIAARLLRDRRIGSVVICEERRVRCIPAGILTARDILPILRW